MTCERSRAPKRERAVLPPHAPGLKIGLFGGTFDPPHRAHLAASLLAMKRIGLDRVWWLVTPGNPLKDTRGLAPLADRIIVMCGGRITGERPAGATDQRDLGLLIFGETIDLDQRAGDRNVKRLPPRADNNGERRKVAPQASDFRRRPAAGIDPALRPHRGEPAAPPARSAGGVVRRGVVTRGMCAELVGDMMAG